MPAAATSSASSIAAPRARRKLTALLAVVVTLLASAALVSAASAASFEWEAAPINGVNAGFIATDQAGRVYVPVRNGGRVQIYNSARNGNGLITEIGAGLLQDPISVAVDNRGNIYIADAARGVVLLYGPYISGASYLGTAGGPGNALGQFGGLQQLATDLEPRVYSAESANNRVQSLDPARGSFTSLFAFGTADPAPWGAVTGVAVDNRNQFFVSSATAGTAPRLFDSRGAFVAQVGAPGSGAGQTDGPRGVGTDPIGRLLVADTGNNRVAFFNSAAGGLGFIDNFGSAGGGAGQFSGPGSIAAAPGALVYVADNGNSRIVRLRYDDADHDGAIDAADNCPGLTNQSQIDHDGDARGDACDDDIDGDGKPNGSDACPLTRPYDDANGDGCQDPFTTAIKPKSKSKVKKSNGLKVSGRAKADALGVARVAVAVGRRHGKTCAWFSATKQRFVVGSCAKPRYNKARGSSSWYLKVPAAALRKGGYRVYTRAVQKRSGMVEAASGVRSSFTVVE